MILMVKNGRCGHFVADNLRAACARQSTCIRKLVKATAAVGLTVDDSFSLVICDLGDARLVGIREHFLSVPLANELFLRRKFYRPCPFVRWWLLNRDIRGSWWVMSLVSNAKVLDCSSMDCCPQWELFEDLSHSFEDHDHFIWTVLQFSGSVEMYNL